MGIETFTENAAAAEAVDASAPVGDVPRSPSEAIDRVDHFSEQAHQIAADSEVQPLEAPMEEPESDFLDLVPSDEFTAGYYEALAEAGLIERPAPSVDDPGYVDWAQDQLEQRLEENAELVERLALLTDNSPELVEQALAIADASEQQRQAVEQQAALERAEQIRATGVAHIEGIAEEIGAPGYVDADRVLEVARSVHAEVTRMYGPEEAQRLGPMIYRTAAEHVASEFEEHASTMRKAVERAGSHLGNRAPDPIEVLMAYEDLYPRRLREADGDEVAAMHATLSDAVRQVAGDAATPREVVLKHWGEQRRLEAMEKAARGEPAKPAPLPEPSHFGSHKELLNFYARRAQALAREGQ